MPVAGIVGAAAVVGGIGVGGALGVGGAADASGNSGILGNVGAGGYVGIVGIVQDSAFVRIIMLLPLLGLRSLSFYIFVVNVRSKASLTMIRALDLNLALGLRSLLFFCS